MDNGVCFCIGDQCGHIYLDIADIHCMECGAKMAYDARNIMSWYIMRVGSEFYVAYCVRCSECIAQCNASIITLGAYDTILRDTSAQYNGIFCPYGDVDTFLFRACCVLIMREYYNADIYAVSPDACMMITNIFGYISRGLRANMFVCHARDRHDTVVISDAKLKSEQRLDLYRECRILLDVDSARECIYCAKVASVRAQYVARYSARIVDSMRNASIPIKPVSFDSLRATVSITIV